jgi:hypothetical protein
VHPASIVLQDRQIRRRFPVQLVLGPQLRIFIVQRSVTSALSASFAMLDLPLLCVAPLAHFAIL